MSLQNEDTPHITSPVSVSAAELPALSESAPAPAEAKPKWLDAVEVSRLIRAAIYNRPEDAHLHHAGVRVVAQLDTLKDENKPGPDVGEPTLGLRTRRNKKGDYKSMIVIMHGSEYAASTGVRPRPGEDYRKNERALAKLDDYNYRRRMNALAEFCDPEVTIGDVIDEYLEDHEPTSEAMKEASGKRYDELCDHGAQLCELPELKMLKLRSPMGGIGIDYANFRTNQPKKTCSPDNPGPGKVSLETAIKQLKTLRQMLRYHAQKWGKPVKTFVMPKNVKKAKRWITWYQLMALLLAARGYFFDEDGNLLRDAVTLEDGTIKWVPRRLPPDERADFEMVERFIVLYLYGLRHTKNLRVRWHHSPDFGYIDFVNGLVVRSGQTEPLTHKEALPSKLHPSLERCARKWKRLDDKRGFKYVVHDRHGNPRKASMSYPFKDVARNAGIPWFRPHMLKHTAVTLMTYAGMPAPALMETFSTTYKTLFNNYTHLRPFWMSGSTVAWSLENVGLRALKKISPSQAHPRLGGPLPR
ncbi:integrase [Bradyrhizobium sp. USDA 4472]